MVLFHITQQYYDLQISWISTITILMVSASPVIDNMCGLLLLDAIAVLCLKNPHSLVKITFVMVFQLNNILNFSGLPSNVGEIPPGSTKSYLVQLLILK